MDGYAFNPSSVLVVPKDKREICWPQIKLHRYLTMADDIIIAVHPIAALCPTIGMLFHAYSHFSYFVASWIFHTEKKIIPIIIGFNSSRTKYVQICNFFSLFLMKQIWHGTSKQNQFPFSVVRFLPENWSSCVI